MFVCINLISKEENSKQDENAGTVGLLLSEQPCATSIQDLFR